MAQWMAVTQTPELYRQIQFTWHHNSKNEHKYQEVIISTAVSAVLPGEEGGGGGFGAADDVGSLLIAQSFALVDSCRWLISFYRLCTA